MVHSLTHLPLLKGGKHGGIAKARMLSLHVAIAPYLRMIAVCLGG